MTKQTPTPSFRLPQAFDIPSHIEHEGMKIPFPKAVRDNIRMLFNGMTDSQQAFASLKDQLETLKSQVAATIPGAAAAPAAAGPTPGGVNDQSGAAAVTTQSSDYGGLVVVNNASTPVPVTLNSSVSSSFYTHITNNGSATSTVTPDVAGATINGAPSYALGAGQSISLFYNGATKNWYAA